MKKFKYDWLFYLPLFLCFFVSAILLLWVPDIRQNGIMIVKYVVGAAVFIYVGVYLVPSYVRSLAIKSNANPDSLVVRELKLVEIVIILICSVCLFVSQGFPTINQVIAICLYFWSFIKIIDCSEKKPLTYQEDGEKNLLKKSTVYISILLMTIGTWMFFDNQVITEENVVTMVAILLFVGGVSCLYFGIAHFLEWKKESKVKKEELSKETEKKNE